MKIKIPGIVYRASYHQLVVNIGLGVREIRRSGGILPSQPKNYVIQTIYKAKFKILMRGGLHQVCSVFRKTPQPWSDVPPPSLSI